MAEITDVDRLRELLGEPRGPALVKDRQALEDPHLAWLRESPMCLVATSDADGACDVSPKGDPAGSLVHVVDARTIALAERPGNRRADGFLNILTNPHVGLIFLIPGRGDTLRVNGRARLLDDAPYADELVVRGHRPLVICEVTVEQIFFHCSKAFLRSELWNPDTWRPEAAPKRAHIAHALERSDQPLADVEAYYESPDYAAGLY